MKILALDTATEACSAALYIDGEISEIYQLAPREHTKLILQMIKSLLKQADLKITDLDALAFGRGPGSFTGVRIATGVVQGLAFAADLPVLPISTLASIAQQVFENHQQENVLAGIDARMGEIYWACYQKDDNDLMQLMGDEKVSTAENIILENDKHWCGGGSAWQTYVEPLANHLGASLSDFHADYYPSASSVVKLAVHEFLLGNSVSAAYAQPVYLRNDVAKKSSRQ